MEIFKKQMKLLFGKQQSDQEGHQIADKGTQISTPSPPYQQSNRIDVVWFDRGIDLDEIERKSDYRGRRNITALDLQL